MKTIAPMIVAFVSAAMIGCAPGQPFHRTTTAEIDAQERAEFAEQAAARKADAAAAAARFEQRYPYFIFLGDQRRKICGDAPESDKCTDAKGKFLAEGQRIQDESELNRSIIQLRYSTYP